MTGRRRLAAFAPSGMDGHHGQDVRSSRELPQTHVRRNRPATLPPAIIARRWNRRRNQSWRTYNPFQHRANRHPAYARDAPRSNCPGRLAAQCPGRPPGTSGPRTAAHSPTQPLDKNQQVFDHPNATLTQAGSCCQNQNQSNTRFSLLLGRPAGPPKALVYRCFVKCEYKTPLNTILPDFHRTATTGLRKPAGPIVANACGPDYDGPSGEENRTTRRGKEYQAACSSC